MRAASTVVALAGFLLGASAGPGLEPVLVWASVWSAPAGALSALDGRRGWLAAAGPALAVLLARPAPDWPAAAVLLGLFLAGRGLGALARGDAARVVTLATGALLAAALLVALPVRGDLGRAPWPPAVAARLLDLSPATLTMEAAGVDWLRRPAVYEGAGGDAIGPSLRAPYRPALAGATAIVVGLAALALCARVAARTRS